MSSRFRSLTPDGERPAEDEISIDLEKFEAELNASIAKLDGKPRPAPPPVKSAGADDSAQRFPPLAVPQPSPIPSTPAVTAAPPAATPAPPNKNATTQSGAGFDLLSELRQAAEEKSIAAQAINNERKSRVERTDRAMRSLFRYLAEFSGHLNKIQPAVPQTFIPLPNLDLSALHWAESFIDYRTDGGTEVSPIDSISLRYTLDAGNSICVQKLPNHAMPYLEELKRVGLPFASHEKRGSRGLVEQTDFTIKRAIVVNLLFKANFAQETITLQARNFSGLGNTTYTVKVADLDSALLDDLGKYILGRPNNLFQRLIKEKSRHEQ